MREIRTSGSEGGGVEPNRPSLPLSWRHRLELSQAVARLSDDDGLARRSDGPRLTIIVGWLP